jgi:WD40 repeat protein
MGLQVPTRDPDAFATARARIDRSLERSLGARRVPHLPKFAAGWGEAVAWDAATGARVAQILVQPERGDLPWTGNLSSAAWSPDGSKVALALNDARILVWDAVARAAALAIRGRTAGRRCLAWSPDAGKIASGGGDGELAIWDVVTGATIAELRGHTAAVLAVAWSPDSSRLASAGADQSVRIWDSDRDVGRELALAMGLHPRLGHGGPVAELGSDLLSAVARLASDLRWAPAAGREFVGRGA